MEDKIIGAERIVEMLREKYCRCNVVKDKDCVSCFHLDKTLIEFKKEVGK